MEKMKQINVGGQMFLLSSMDLENGPSSRLKQMFIDGSLNSHSAVVIHRPSELFAAILAFYQTGELHIPASACPVAFKNELRFWNIPLAMLSTCCRNRLKAVIENQETLDSFRKTFQPVERKIGQSSNPHCKSLEKYRSKIWSIVEYTEPSRFTKIYFTVSLLMILLSIFVVAFGTDPRFQRDMTSCEQLEYMAASGTKDYELAKITLEKNCLKEESPGSENNESRRLNSSPSGYNDDEYTDVYITYNETALSDDDVDKESAIVAVVGVSTTPDFSFNKTENSKRSKNVQSVARKQPSITPSPSLSTTFETRETFLNKSKPKGRYVKIPNMKIKIYSLVILEIICFVYFTIDFILRITTCPSVKFYFLSIINITDALALTGMITNLVMISIYEQERYKESWTDLLEYTQTLRALRLFRIVSGLKAGRVLAYTVRANYKELFVLVVFLVAGMCTFASVLFITEDKQNVKTIPVAWYWVIVTMTTVGYGDMVPKTFIGRLTCCLCAISGVLLFALIVPIFANNYLTLYQFAGHNKELDEYDTLQTDEKICLEISKDNTDNEEMSREVEKNTGRHTRLLIKEN